MKKVILGITLALVFSIAGISYLQAVDTDSSAVKTECQADLNGDGVVNTADLLIFLPCYNCHTTPSCIGCQPADFNGDHKVDWQDYMIIMSEISTNCGQ